MLWNVLCTIVTYIIESFKQCLLNKKGICCLHYTFYVICGVRIHGRGLGWEPARKISFPRLCDNTADKAEELMVSCTSRSVSGKGCYSFHILVRDPLALLPLTGHSLLSSLHVYY